MKLAVAMLAIALTAYGQEHGAAPAAPAQGQTAAPAAPQEHGPSAPAEAGHSNPSAAGQHAADAVTKGEGHESQPMPNEIWWKWANFAVLALGLGFLIGKNAGPFFRARTESIQKGIREAAAMRADAEARAAEIEKRIGNLTAEVETLRQRSREEIAREGERIQAETAASITKIRNQAQADIEAAARNARADLKAYSAELAVNLAKQQIQGRMTDSTQHQLADAFVDDLRKKAALN